MRHQSKGRSRKRGEDATSRAQTTRGGQWKGASVAAAAAASGEGSHERPRAFYRAVGSFKQASPASHLTTAGD